MVNLASKIINFYRSIQIPVVPKEIEVLYPQQSEEVMLVVENFFNRFYNDVNPRRLIFGINPGRFGGGTTGINFTAPKQLSEFCHIDHSFRPQSELSAEFIYDLILAY